MTEIAFINSTPIAVCHPYRDRSYKVFRNFAQWGKTSLEIAKILLETGANINPKNLAEKQLCFFAKQGGYSEIAQLLLNAEVTND